ncbi:glycosyltransferase [Kocuria flava]|uniref:glycosyltransferase n=1 Tax=Kocuria flava TaxID=446860 RepID=UPI003F1B93B2
MIQRWDKMSRTVLIATSGGHLTQLYTLCRRMELEEPPIWITVDSPQSRSLLADEEVIFMPYSPPRDVFGTVKNAFSIARKLRHFSHSRFISTGASIALSGLPIAYAHRSKFCYIESATRVSGLSLTGRVMSLVPGIERYVQYPHLKNKKWKYGFSVFDEFAAESRVLSVDPSHLKIFVTVGANKNYGFPRLIDAVQRAAPSGADVFVQYGPTDMSKFDFPGSSSLTAAEIDERIDWADVVVSHAGTGSALSSLRRGKLPVLIPRRFDMHEHIDDHQSDLANFLNDRGLALVTTVEQLDTSHLVRAAASQISVNRNILPITI